MKISTKIALGVFAIIFGILIKKFRDLTFSVKAPIVASDTYWGPGNFSAYKEDVSIKPKKITYNESIIEDLKFRLNDFPKYQTPLEGINFEYGFNTKNLKKVITYWRNEYLPKWRKREARINSFPHYTTQIQGLNIHFIHVKPKTKVGLKVIPIILLHGWPGSVLEFYDVIPKMTTESADKEFVFNVVVPSLPGYGWSKAASKPGLGTVEMAVIMKNLMNRLGYEKFYVQGGDWGSVIGSSMASLYPKNVIGYHSNFCLNMAPFAAIKTVVASYFPTSFVDSKYKDFHFPLSDKIHFALQESGYMHIQATKPDTIGLLLTENPIGLAAYLLEKFSTWTDPSYVSLKDAGLTKDFTLDVLLDNVMIYYLTNSITTSQRLYKEWHSDRELAYNMDRVQVKIPTGCARFKNDLSHQIDSVLQDKFSHLVHSTYHMEGGHFAALQVPEVFYKDLMIFVKIVEEHHYY